MQYSSRQRSLTLRAWCLLHASVTSLGSDASVVLTKDREVAATQAAAFDTFSFGLPLETTVTAGLRPSDEGVDFTCVSEWYNDCCCMDEDAEEKLTCSDARPTSCAKGDDVIIRLTRMQSVWEQAGWMFMIATVAVVFAGCGRLRKKPKGIVFQNQDHSPVLREVFLMLWQKSFAGNVLEVVLGILAIFSFCIYAQSSADHRNLATEHGLPVWIEIWTAILIMCCYAGRLYACPLVNRLKSSKYPRLQYACTDLLMWLDLFAAMPTLVDIFVPQELPNLIWLRGARILDAILRSRFGGVGVEVFRRLLSRNVDILLISVYLFLIAWICFATLHYVTEQTNSQLFWGVDPGFQRYKSIPAALYYTLVDFMGEFPNAGDFSTPWGRIVVILICFFGTALVEIPAGIVGFAFQSHVREVFRRAKGEQRPSSIGLGELKRGHRLDGRTNGVMTSVASMVSCAIFIMCTGLCQHVEGTGLSARLVFPSPNHWRIVALCISRYFECLLIAPFFARDWALRVRDAQNQSVYLTSVRHVADLMSFLPSTVLLMSLLIFGNCVAGVEGHLDHIASFQLALHASIVVRLFKLDRFLGRIFSELGGIMSDNKEVFGLTFSAAVAFWLMASVAMYMCESTNPDSGTRKNFQSVQRSFWMTLLDFTGEVPVNDHGPQGKAVHTVIMLVGMGIFTVPMGIFGAALRYRLDEALATETEERLASYGPTSRVYDLPRASRPRGSITLEEVHRDNMRDERDTCDRHLMLLTVGTWQYKTHKLLLGSRHPSNASNLKAKLVENAIKVVTVLGTLLSIMETTEGFENCAEGVTLFSKKLSTESCLVVRYSLRVMTTACVLCYLAELVVRIACHPNRRRFLISITGIFDMIAIAPTILLVFTSVLGPPTPAISRLTSCLRIWRFFAIDRFTNSLQVFRDVISARSRQLLQVVYVLVAVWALLTNLNWYFLHDSLLHEGDVYLMSRYGQYWKAMMYSLIHMSGDYPITNYPLSVKIYQTVSLFLGWTFVALPAGLITAAFADAMETRRSILLQRRLQACNQITRLLKRAVRLRRLARIVNDARVQYQARRSMLRNMRSSNSALHEYFRVLDSKRHRVMVVATTSIYIVLVWMRTVPELQGAEMMWDLVMTPFNAFFWFHFLLRLHTSPVRATSKYPRLKFLLKSRHLCLLSALLIWVLHIFGRWCPFGFFQPPFSLCFVLVSQILFLLQLEDAIHTGRIWTLVWTEMRDNIFAMYFVVLGFWLFTATLWFLSERERGIGLTSMSSTMYYTSIFMLGEWCQTDFSFAGALLCMSYCILGVALSAMPIAAMTDALTAVIEAKGASFVYAGKLDEPREDAPAQDSQLVDGPDKSGNGTVEQVGVRISGTFRCVECRQRYDTPAALDTHWKYFHDPNRFHED
eukprot:TRINITY_DN5237_c1_g1_i1.p1 TRINITY_DN5237_c1_g1~~TRINITY_DN5237_c1_g1_i1.p1  ORF type:complete len:1397 (+),score=167.03 TRINITY_DN5237_c1_g1_i1:77-4267(+)